MTTASLLIPPPPEGLRRKVLERVLPMPTAPFNEHAVRAALSSLLSEEKISTRKDSSGNLLASYRSGKAKAQSWLAHMDHPGFEILSLSPDGTASARWHGQVPSFELRKSTMRLAKNGADRPHPKKAVVLAGDGREQGRDALISLQVPAGVSVGDFGYADLPPLQYRSGRIVSKALDNLAGCCAITVALIHLKRSRLPGDVLAIFTRAEEVGFKGSFAAIRSGILPKSRPVVVLECSREMPGALIGKGPVIRTGDKLRVFDPDLILAMENAARLHAERRPSFQWQRRLMDGGSCEASAFSLAGYAAACLAFPLGNYHNVGVRGIAAEEISEADFQNGIEALCAFAAFGLDPKKARTETARGLAARFTGQDAVRLRKSA